MNKELVDIQAEEVTGIQINYTGTKLWVCVDGQCILRVNSPEIELLDSRPLEERR